MEDLAHDIHTITHFNEKLKGIFIISVIFMINYSFLYFNTKTNTENLNLQQQYNPQQHSISHSLRQLENTEDREKLLESKT
jgi:Na+/H+ antiporter NhaC